MDNVKIKLSHNIIYNKKIFLKGEIVECDQEFARYVLAMKQGENYETQEIGKEIELKNTDSKSSINKEEELNKITKRKK